MEDKIKVLYIGWNASGGEKTFRRILSLDNNSNIHIDYLLFNIGTSYYLNGRKINSYPMLLKEIEKNGPYEIIHVGNPLVADTNGGGFRGIINSASKYEVDPKILSTIHSLFAFEIAVGSDYEEVGNEKILKTARERLFLSKDDTRSRAQQEIMEVADKIVVPSSFYKEAISHLYPEYEEKIQIIPNGSDIYKYKNGFSNSHEEINSKSKRQFIIFYHGRITPLKGLRELSYAVRNFNREFSSKIVLLMAGKYYNYSFIRELESIDEHISYLGELQGEELIKRILQSDLIVQPTYHDSFNLSALEGLMLRKKVIVTYISSMPELWVKPAYAVGVLPNPYILGRENEMETHCVVTSKYFIEALKNTLRDVLLKDEYTSKSPHDIQKEVKERYNEKRMQELYRDLYFSLL
jgi:glycosyltransferase involved in cell wall biosynthesis